VHGILVLIVMFLCINLSVFVSMAEMHFTDNSVMCIRVKKGVSLMQLMPVKIGPGHLLL